jgi:uncharacterized membrane protein
MAQKTAQFPRVWFSLTAALAVAGLIVQLYATFQATSGHFVTPLQRSLNVFSFFTIQSNILVAISFCHLAMAPVRRSRFAEAVRLSALLGIIATGIVYHTVLSGLHDLTSWALVADLILHTFVPLLAFGGWLLFGPHRPKSFRFMFVAIIFPILWVIFTLIRGAFVHWYPYPFIDVDSFGYARVTANCIVVALLFCVILGIIYGVDKALGRRSKA